MELDSFICFGFSYSQLMRVLGFGICQAGHVGHEYNMLAGMLRIKQIAYFMLFVFCFQGGLSLA